jgi:hypothetical protein
MDKKSAVYENGGFLILKAEKGDNFCPFGQKKEVTQTPPAEAAFFVYTKKHKE